MKLKFWINLISAIICAGVGTWMIILSRTATVYDGYRTADQERQAIIFLVVALVLGVFAVVLGSLAAIVYFRKKNEQDRAMIEALAREEAVADHLPEGDPSSVQQ